MNVGDLIQFTQRNIVGSIFLSHRTGIILKIDRYEWAPDGTIPSALVLWSGSPLMVKWAQLEWLTLVKAE